MNWQRNDREFRTRRGLLREALEKLTASLDSAEAQLAMQGEGSADADQASVGRTRHDGRAS